MLKNQARDLFLQQRLNFTPQVLQSISNAWLVQFKKIQLPKLSSLLSYIPIEQKNEANPQLCTDWLRNINNDLNLYFPAINFHKNRLSPIQIQTNTQFIKNKWGILEPIPNQTNVEEKKMDIKIVFVPLIIMDIKGNRIGYGKGYYDQFFNEHPYIKYKIGFSCLDAIETISDMQEFDQRLTHGISPNHCYVF